MAFQYAEQSVEENESHCSAATSPQSPVSDCQASCRFLGEGIFPREQSGVASTSGQEDPDNLPELSPEVITRLDAFLDNFFIPSIEQTATLQTEKFVPYLQWNEINENTTNPTVQEEISTKPTENMQLQQCYTQKTEQIETGAAPQDSENNQKPPCEGRPQCAESTRLYHATNSNNHTEQNLDVKLAKSEPENENVSLTADSVIDFDSLAQFLQSADDNEMGIDILAEFNTEVPCDFTYSPAATAESFSLSANTSTCENIEEQSMSWSLMDESPKSNMDRRLASTPVSGGEESSGYLSATDMDSSSYLSQISSQPVSPIQFNASRPSTPDVGNEQVTETRNVANKETEEKKSDENKPNKKPAETYVSMIAKAMLANSLQRMSLSDLYSKIEELFPYYKTSTITWRNAVRHNLSINECFVKAGRADSGRGFYWTIHPSCVEVFRSGKYKRRDARRRVQNLTRIGTVNVTPFTPMTVNTCQHPVDINEYQYTIPAQMSSTSVNTQLQGLEVHANMLTNHQTGYYSTPRTSTPSRNYLYHPYQQYHY